MRDSRGGKKTCKYYAACGSVDNCIRCEGYCKKKETKNADSKNR